MSLLTAPPTVASPLPELPGTTAITQASHSNLALSFAALPAREQRAMSTFYAFCRVVDDVADSTELPLEQKRAQLREWRHELHRAYQAEPRTPLGRELAGIIRLYLIPPTPLEEILNGVEMDLETTRYATFAELEIYCYRVASAVGLCSIEIFGCRHPRSRDYAVALGLAFQLTNILRDVKKDASFNRIYLPLDEIARFGVTENDILEGRDSKQMRQLFRFQYERAVHYFAKAHRLMVASDRGALVAAEIMRGVYESLLHAIAAQGFATLRRPVRLSKWRKARLVLATRWIERRAEPRPPPPKKVVVLGGGYAGLAAAAELIRRGHHVTLLESRALLGGRAHSFSDAKTGTTLDNGQHVLMGCYHQTLALLRRLGVEDRLTRPSRLHVPFLSPKGPSRLRATWPTPLHLLSALLAYRELGWRDRAAAIRLVMGLGFGSGPYESETVAAWLQRTRQTEPLTRALWEPLCLAALNEPLASASSRLFAQVLRQCFLGKADAATLRLSRVGLSELFAPEVVCLLEMCGSHVQMQTPITALGFEGAILKTITLGNGSTLKPEAVVSALPWNALRGLLPPGSRLKQALHDLGEAPIISLHLWLDRPILTEPFVGLLESPVHWLFQRDQIQGPGPFKGGHILTVVMSGARKLIDLPGSELEAICLREIARFFPSAADIQVRHRVVYKARSATFAATPAAEKLRPGPATPWSNFWLAGDFTNTGLPATIEGAVVSGLRAAHAIDTAT